VVARNSAAVADTRADAVGTVVVARSPPAAQAAGAEDRAVGAAPAAEVRAVVRRGAAVGAAVAVSRAVVSRELKR
jgi:hypothetical protein